MSILLFWVTTPKLYLDFSYDPNMFHDIVLHGMLCVRNTAWLAGDARN